MAIGSGAGVEPYSGFASTNASNEAVAGGGAGLAFGSKAALSFGTRPASIQLKWPLLTLSVGRTQPSTIHCFSVSKSVSKVPSIVLTRQTSGCALMFVSFPRGRRQVEQDCRVGEWNSGGLDQSRCSDTNGPNQAPSTNCFDSSINPYL